MYFIIKSQYKYYFFVYFNFSITQSVIPFVNGNSLIEHQFENTTHKGKLHYTHISRKYTIKLVFSVCKIKIKNMYHVYLKRRGTINTRHIIFN